MNAKPFSKTPALSVQGRAPVSIQRLARSLELANSMGRNRLKNFEHPMSLEHGRSDMYRRPCTKHSLKGRGNRETAPQALVAEDFSTMLIGRQVQ